MINKLLFAATLACWGLVGCSSFGGVEDYQLSDTIKELEYPEDIAAVNLPPLYPIPEVNVKEEAFYNIETDGFVVPRPEPMSAERQQAKVKIQKVGERRWILAEAPTSQVWPLAQNFLMQYDMGTSQSNPRAGLVQTDWVVFSDAPDQLHQFRIRIEQGVREETTEIHAIQRSTVPGANPEPWSSQSPDSAREEWLLLEMANSLAGNINNRAASLLGQSVGGQIKAELFMDGEEPALLLRLDKQRAWATVAQAASKGDFMLWDEDSERGVIYLQHKSLVRRRNWFLKLFVGEYNHIEQRPFPIGDALNHLDDTQMARSLFSPIAGVDFNEPQPNARGLLLVLDTEGEDQVVKIRDVSGNKLPLRENKTYLAIIRRHLI